MIRFCRDCGSEFHTNSSFCPTCGARRPGELDVDAPASRRGRGRWLVLVPLVMLLAAIMTFGIMRLTGSGGSDDARPRTSSTVSTIVATTSTTTPSTTIPAPTTTAAAMDIGGDGGHWVAILASIPTSTPSGQVDATIESLRSRYPALMVLTSDDYSSLRPGYVVVYRGPWAASEDATRYCNDIGRAVPSECYARFVQR